ncbi:hypothetical protein AAHE18_03G239100 [Arachis hypogaea]
MTSFTIPCPKCLSFSHLGLNSQTTQRNMHVAGLGLKKSQSFGSLVCDSNSIGVQAWVKWGQRRQFIPQNKLALGRA